ncbi:hypothetical protein AAFC00_005321 [Neodothiora populina]|uniref:PPPDE domain-containing protein n=1 Tax=Neodothiora populina TaxID=2781224 RepID=A0ABR3PKJ3_9PEZI
MASSSSSSRSSRHHQKSSSLNRASIAAQKTEIIIHVYDLLPPGRLSSLLWTFGGSLLHSGVVIKGKEYAYGGHDRKGVSGVYWTRPKLEPPGGTFKCEILHGFTFQTEQEINQIICETSSKFQGTSYNLLSNNCNHFTSYLVEQLTSKPAPTWINRAASIGLAMPCVVPKEWVSPPDHETADGELLEEDEEDDDEHDEDDENAAMLASDRRRRRREQKSRSRSSSGATTPRHNRLMSRDQTPPPRVVSVKDTSGRQMPASERAPLPNKK